MKVLILLVSLTVLVLGDENGQYVGDNSGQYVPTGDEGRYYPDNSGQYRDDGTGRYAGDGSGRYSGQNDGLSRSGRNSGNLYGSGSANRQIYRQPSSTAAPKVKRVQPTLPPPPPAARFNYDNYREGGYKIIRQLNDVDTDGGYHWEYETENKISAEESGKIANKGTDAETMRAKGFYQYTGPDNVVYSVSYTADENGFIPIGDHLPTPPPIPEAIAKALEYNGVDKNRI